MADIRINALATTAASTASDDFVAVDGSANGTRKLNAFSPTFGGNLTVSGTGTSSVAGNLTLSTSGSSINTGTSDASDNKYISLSGGGAAANTRGASVYVTGNEFTTGNAKGSLQFEAGYDATMSNTMDGSVLFSTGGTAVVGYFNRLGNLKLGPAAADSANGKLQLATHTTAAGGIGFGTDVSLFRNNATELTVNASAFKVTPASGNAFIYNTVAGGGIAGLAFIDSQASGRTFGIETGRTAGSFSIRDYTAGSNRLTIDSSGAATFAGAVTVPSLFMSTDAQGSILSSSGNTLFIDAAAGGIMVRPKAGSAFIIGNSAALRLGSTYVAGAPTATGYVNIQDSLGNTYKVLVGT